jgi:hypothetical protein
LRMKGKESRIGGTIRMVATVPMVDIQLVTPGSAVQRRRNAWDKAFEVE